MNWYKRAQSEEIPTAERTILSTCERLHSLWPDNGVKIDNEKIRDDRIRSLLNVIKIYSERIKLPLKSTGYAAQLISKAIDTVNTLNLKDPHLVGNKLQDLDIKCFLYLREKNKTKTAQSSRINVWVDDIHAPPEGWNWLWAKNYDEAIAYLQTGNVEKMSLDHDLGDADAKSGADITRWIAEEAYYGRIPRIEFGIHTDNPIGRKNMTIDIKNAYKFWDQHENEDNELV